MPKTTLKMATTTRIDDHFDREDEKETNHSNAIDHERPRIQQKFDTKNLKILTNITQRIHSWLQKKNLQKNTHFSDATTTRCNTRSQKWMTLFGLWLMKSNATNCTNTISANNSLSLSLQALFATTILMTQHSACVGRITIHFELEVT